MDNESTLEKDVWTEADFEMMGWHDNKIHAIAFDEDNDQLLLDIDYICKWVKKEPVFSFWVAPATLIFRNVYNVNIFSCSTSLFIDDVERNNPKAPKNSNHISEQVEYDWSILTHEGEITFTSVGFTQYIRTNPVLIDWLGLSLVDRGGYSFAANIR